MIDYKRLQFLERCAELSNDSWGEMLTGLLSAYRLHHSMTSNEFLEALEKEILEQIEWAEENCKIVQKTENRTVTYYDLEVAGVDY